MKEADYEAWMRMRNIGYPMNEEWESIKDRGVLLAKKLEASGEDKFEWVLSLRFAADLLKEADHKEASVSDVLLRRRNAETKRKGPSRKEE